MSTKVEWYRRTSWTDRDAAEFEERLARSRGADRKAQYLRIQAVHLLEIGDLALIRVALSLLDRVVNEYPVQFELAQVLSLRAGALVDLGHLDEALATYQRALEARRAFPRVGDNGFVDFAELVVAMRRHDLYDSALAALNEFSSEPTFPILAFRIAAARALIAAERNDGVAAKKWAREAVAAAAKSDSPFRYHRKVGLVRGVDPLMFSRLESLAS